MAIEALENGPQSSAQGRNPRWMRLGEVCVDACSVMIVEPQNAKDFDRAPGAESNRPFSHDFGSGVEFMPGFGDGGYAVYGLVVDYGTGGEVDQRVAEIRMVFITEEDLADWRSQ